MKVYNYYFYWNYTINLLNNFSYLDIDRSGEITEHVLKLVGTYTNKQHKVSKLLEIHMNSTAFGLSEKLFFSLINAINQFT